MLILYYMHLLTGARGYNLTEPPLYKSSCIHQSYITPIIRDTFVQPCPKLIERLLEDSLKIKHPHHLRYEISTSTSTISSSEFLQQSKSLPDLSHLRRNLETKSERHLESHGWTSGDLRDRVLGVDSPTPHAGVCHLLSQKTLPGKLSLWVPVFAWDFKLRCRFWQLGDSKAWWRLCCSTAFRWGTRDPDNRIKCETFKNIFWESSDIKNIKILANVVSICRWTSECAK